MTRASLAVAAAFAMTAGSIAASREMHPALAVTAFAIALLAILVGLLRGGGTTRPIAASWVTPEALGLILLAVATAIVILDRHELVASSALAPDDIAASAAIVTAAIAVVRGPATPRWRAVVYGLALASYALAGATLIYAKPYHSDAVVASHAGAELLLSGRHPYADFDMYEQLPRFGLTTDWATDLDDGSELRSLNYPALAVLVPAPFVALGLEDVRALYLAEVLALVTLVAFSAAEPWRAFALAAALGNATVLRQHVAAGIDPTWALLILIAWLARERRWSAVPLGLAVAARQTAWPIALFLVAWSWRRQGRRETAVRVAVAAGIALALHLPFLLTAPRAVIAGITDVVRLPLVAGGVGPSQLLPAGSPRELYLALAVAGLAVAFGWWWRSLREGAGRAALVLPLLPLYLASRALQSYFALLPLFLLVEEGRRPVHTRPADSSSQAPASRAVPKVGLTSDGNH